MFNVKLNKQERIIIKRIAKIQVNSLEGILNNDCETDMTMFFIENEISKELFKEELELQIKTFRDLQRSPDLFITLDDEDMSIVKHILFSCLNKVKYRTGKSGVWKKIFLKEKFLFNLN